MRKRLPRALALSMFFLTVSARAQTGRVDITQAMLPLVITSPGSYRLAQDVTITNRDVHGITVKASDVRIDFHGHELAGPGLGTGSGIFQAESFGHLTVSNGIVRGWDGDPTAFPDGGYGVLARGSKADIRDFTVTACERGILAGPLSTAKDVTVYSNRMHGLFLRRGGLASTCTAYDTGAGFECEADSTFDLCTSYNNSGDGFRADKDADFTGCTAYHNGVGVRCGTGCDLTSVTAYQNRDVGIEADHDCTISEATVNENGGDGIRVGSNCGLDRNTAHENVRAGIRVLGSGNQMTGNKTIGNGEGIVVSASGNSLSKNISGENKKVNYAVSGTNDVAPVVSETEAAVGTNTDVNIETTPAGPSK